MKGKQRIVYIIVLIVVGLSSCGLHYVPTESPEAYQLRRREAIETYIRQNLEADSSSYSSIAFGQTQVIKPASFLKLDSLYEVKYQNEKNNIRNKEHESQIEAQIAIAEDDKDKIKYIEFLVFKFGLKDTIQIIETEVLTDKSFAILDQKIISSLPLPKGQLETYKKYLFEESFLYPTTSPTTAEQYFYEFYKAKSATLFGDKRDAFVLHTLNIMELAHRKKSVQTVELLIALSHSNISIASPQIQINLVNEVYLTENQNYWFTIDCTNENGQKMKYYFEYTPYLELLRMELV